jgi:hypothetical protein
MKVLVPNCSCLQNPWLGGYRPQIPVLSVLCPQLNLLNPPKKIPGYATGLSRDHLAPSVPKFTIFFYSDDRSNRYLRNDGKFLPEYRASQHRDIFDHHRGHTGSGTQKKTTDAVWEQSGRKVKLTSHFVANNIQLTALSFTTSHRYVYA